MALLILAGRRPAVRLFCAHVEVVARPFTSLASQVSRGMNMETVLTFREFAKCSMYLGSRWGLGKNDFAFDSVCTCKQCHCHSTMADSILVTLLLNEAGFKNVWVVYLLYAILTFVYSLYLNLFAAMTYAALTLELVFSFIEIIINASIQWAVQRRNPTMTAI